MTETTILLLWLAGAVAFMGVCVLLCRLPLALHLVVGFAAVVGTLYLACFHAPAEEINLGSSYLIFYFHFPCATIIENHQTSRLGFIVLRWYINPIVANRSRKNFALVPDVLGHNTLRYTFLPLRI